MKIYRCLLEGARDQSTWESRKDLGEQMSEEEDRMGEMIVSRVQIIRDEVFPEYSHPE